jgi:hypothetical protein
MVHRWSVDPRTYAVEIAAVDVGGIVAVVDAEEAASTGGVPQGDEGAPVMWADPWEAWRPGLAAPPAEVLS